ncbi:slipin family protein [Sphaerimonospora sp. CA-214678]|uniref:slipin family protein n=1 Tax=Sphaerimonospora sp. CA-214678 TaxID=3240029 RepID=UPI003D8A398D
MESVLSALIVVLGVLLLVAVARGVRVVQQFETGIVFRLGRIQPNVRGPGLHLIVPIVDRMQKVNMQIVAMGVPAQDGITRDNVSVRVDAVVYFRVIDPIKAVVNVQNYLFAVSQVAQTSLRSVIGQSELDHLLSDRDTLNARLRSVIDEPTEGPWGIRIERVEIKDVALPDGMKRSMSRQAEAERERRARIITADGEFQASKRLAAAARQMSSDPAALQLRMLQTVVEVAAEKNSTLVMPLPVEMLRFFDRMAPASSTAATPAAASSADESGSAVPEGSPEQEPEPLEEAIRELPSVESPDIPLTGQRIEPPAWQHHRTAGGGGV